MLNMDRWLEMDLTWFDPSADLEPQMVELLQRIAPLLLSVDGDRGIIFNVGWLIDLVTEWTGNPEQKIPTLSRRTALWGQHTYADFALFLAQLRRHAAQIGLGDLKIGVLFVQWAHVVWPPELKIYDFDSSWYDRHPELYEPPKSFIGMPDLHPINRLLADTYPYAAFPQGLAENTYFPEFFGAQWGHLAEFLNLDALHLRDGFMGPMIYTRNGPYGTTAPPDPSVVAQFSQAVRDLFKAVKIANPSRLVLGYSSAISPVADWRVGCVDFESLVADGYIDAWVEQTWGGAWQDWWHQLWKGWTFQLANLLTRGAMIARANEQRETPCKFYNLIETWDGWEPWDTLHQVPDKLRWAMWAFSHAAVISPEGLKTPDGSYISWINNGDMELLSERDITYLNTHLNAAQASVQELEQVYGTTLVYNRGMIEWLSHNHPEWNVTEWIDDQAAMLMKWGTPALSISRTEWLDLIDLPAAVLMLQTPGHLDKPATDTITRVATPVLVAGRADVLDDAICKRLGINPLEMIEADFHVAEGDSPETPPYDRPYIPEHSAVNVQDDVHVHYRTTQTPLITSRDGWIYWQPPDWSEPFNQFVPKYQLGSTYPPFCVAQLVHRAAQDANLSYIEGLQRPHTIAFHMWRSAGRVHVLLGNLETGEFGDSRTPRHVRLRLSRSQLDMNSYAYQLNRIDLAGENITPTSQDASWLTYDIMLPPEQSAVYVLA